MQVQGDTSHIYALVLLKYGWKWC